MNQPTAQHLKKQADSELACARRLYLRAAMALGSAETAQFKHQAAERERMAKALYERADRAMNREWAS